MERLHRFPLQIDPISVVHQAVEDGVGQRPNKAPVKGGPKTDAKPARQAQEKLRERGGHGLRLPMVDHVKRQQALAEYPDRSMSSGSLCQNRISANTDHVRQKFPMPRAGSHAGVAHTGRER